MATVKMVKGGKYADIFDSPETIRQAQFDGYSLVENEKKVEQPELSLDESKSFVKTQKKSKKD